MIQIKRVYEAAAKTDGDRFLVERLWPRGMKKERLHMTGWLREVAPSNRLRRWFNHDPTKWEEFQRRYRREISEHPDLLDELRRRARCGAITLVYAARNEQLNDAVVLRKVILGQPAPKRRSPHGH